MNSREKLKVRLGINTGFATNRFPEPEEWIRLVKEDFGLKYVQFTADLLNPSLPDNIIKSQVNKIKKNLSKYDVKVEHAFTSSYTRVNHLAHPDKKIQKYWINWFKKFADISRQLGAVSFGSHLGILSIADYKDNSRREARFKDLMKNWKEVASYAKKVGFKYVTWEPMSIAREFGETISETKRLQKILNDEFPIPMKLCLDVDHGDVASKNTNDKNPYEWIRMFGKEAPFIHIKQSLKDKGGHWPFTPEYNKRGIIFPDKIIKSIRESGAKDILLLLELSFREREPFESGVIGDIKDSVEFWKPYVTC